MKKTKQFTLQIIESDCPPTNIQFAGIKYSNLKRASKSIVGQYGIYVAIEILGQAFVLTATEAFRLAQYKIPLTLGFYGVSGLITASSNAEGQKNIQWVPTKRNLPSQPIDRNK